MKAVEQSKSGPV